MAEINFFVLSTEQYKHRKKIIKHTWGKNKNIIFYSDGDDIDTVKCSEKKDYFSAAEKTINIFEKIKNNNLLKFDFNLEDNSWNFFCDDDTFVNTDNLSKYIKKLDSNFVYAKQVYEKQYFCGCDLHEQSTRQNLINLGYKEIIAFMGGAGFLVSTQILKKINRLPKDLLKLDVHGDYVAAAIFDVNEIPVKDELLLSQEHYSFFEESKNIKFPYTNLQNFNEIIKKNISFHRNNFEDMNYLNNLKKGHTNRRISLPIQIDHKHKFHIFEENLNNLNNIKDKFKKNMIIFVYNIIKFLYKHNLDIFGLKNFISAYKISQIFVPDYFTLKDPNQYICVSHSHKINFDNNENIELDHFTYVILKRVISLNFRKLDFNCNSNNFFYSDVNKLFKLRFYNNWLNEFKNYLKVNRELNLDEDILLKKQLLIIK
jgi:hypothetical protein